MVGNLGPDNSGNIYVEFDYNNLIVVDPNKTTKDGQISERLVDHENLVMYANLEAEVLPRTKLAVGISPEDSGLRTISVAKMNFLKPGKNDYLGTGYYDELTGQNVTKFDGTNQPLQVGVIPKNGEKPYIQNTVSNETNVMDNGLLGITQIHVTTNTSFIPSVTMELEDVQGKALFQLGNNSPYSAFFNLPYPPFYLTLKGYYGQAIRYQLNLEKFNARFNSVSGNYQVSLTFKGYKFNILNEIAMGHLLATPHMFSQSFSIGQTPVGPQQTNKSAESQSKTQAAKAFNNVNSPDAIVTELIAERGYQKIVEVYSEYKSKGLISKDLPELTVVQLMSKLEQFETLIMASFDKTEVASLTNIRNYKGILTQYFGSVRGSTGSWFNTYLNPNPIILKGGDKTYVFKNSDPGQQATYISLLESNIKKFNEGLAGNPTLGTQGTAPIPNPIKLDMIKIAPPSDTNIDWVATATAQTGNPKPSQEVIDSVTKQYEPLFTPIFNEIIVNDKKQRTQIKPSFFVFEGNGRFDLTISSLETQANKKLSEYETKITAELLRKIEDKDAGIGFKPTVRNIVAVIMASAEAFIRLMDETHTNAWNVRYDPVRKKAILDNPSSAPSSETRDHRVVDPFVLMNDSTAANSQIPVYPWPQFFVETPDDKKGRFQLKYIADPSVVDLTGGADYSKWPEVQFVEEYMKGLTQKFQTPIAPPPLETDRETNIININAIEFPSTGIAYSNKEEVKFFYEIWERQFLTSHYSGFVRANANQIQDLIKLNVEAEISNVKNGLGLSSPYITFKLKNYGLNAANYPELLKTISNMGTGRAYQDYVRDFFVTPYLRTITEDSFSVLNIEDIGKIPQTSTKSEGLKKLIDNAPNDPLIVDTIPYTDQTWCTNNLNQGASSTGNQVYGTKKSLMIFEPRKIIANFNDVFNYKINRPVTNFSYLTGLNPTAVAISSIIFNGVIPGLSNFYETRTTVNFIPTEGFVYGSTPTGYLSPKTTTSMLNTPYFVNAIQNGVDNSRVSGNTYPYTQAAYLFINSLPLATLREKYKTISDDDVVTELDYISSCFKKFGAIHKIPYAWIIKYGSIWYRYKTYKQTGIDILATAWKNFDYSKNYNPITPVTTGTTTGTTSAGAIISGITTGTSVQYSFKYNGVNRNVVLQSETPISVDMQVGFYPKLINDFNFFYNGYDLYTGYTNSEIQQSVNDGLKMYNFTSSNINNGTQNGKNLRLITWSVMLPNNVPQDDEDCDPTNNTKGATYYVVPSFGTTLNQTVGTCMTGETTSPGTKVNLTNNSSVYNGSVRCLWPATNFGYFDNNQISYPQPDSYINNITTGSEQSPVQFLTYMDYSKIEEIFSVFDKKILDSFEQEFLNFSKPDTDIDFSKEVVTYNQSPINLNSGFRNFQSLFKSLMEVPAKKTDELETDYFGGVIMKQFDVFQNNITNFMQYDVLIRYGNPSNYNRRILNSYLSLYGPIEVADPITFNPYINNSLPTSVGGITLQQSRINNPTAWFELETQVGFSTIANIVYSSNGSYITDFFVDNNIEFTSQNVILLAPIIKMYATQKLKSPTITVAQFKNQLNKYLDLESTLQGNFLNGLLSGLNAILPNQQQLPERAVQSVISGDQSKVENYEVFKSLNDKWISGGDYTTKTLFEDIMFLDRASRNIGDTILVDIFDLKYMFGVGGKPGEYSLNQAMSVYTFISGILIKNNFNVMNLPAYVNFYNVQDADGVKTPLGSGGSLAFADSLWGTFLDVDYRKSGPKMVCFYAGKPSQYLDLPKGNFKYRDDAFEMRRASENPLLENQKGKTDWAVSNKCVGFTVDIGISNQNIFYSFSVSQDNGVATSESINTQLNMVDQASGRQSATQNVSLYNLYKNRSYKCTVNSLGNALIQPTMYFNLRHVPMFNGPYMIQSVEHTIQSGNFQTQFTGIRQGVFDLPAIDSFLQSINQNLLTKLEEILKINKDSVTISGTTNTIKSTQVPQKADNTLDTTNACASNLNSSFAAGYQSVTGTLTKITPKTFADAIIKVAPNNKELQNIIYCLSYIRTFQVDSFNGWNNNLALISLTTDWGGQNTLISRNYSCVKVTTNPSSSSSQPITHFDTIESYIRFMIGRLSPRVDQILEMGLAKWYVCHWPTDNVSEDYYDSHINEFKQTKDTLYEALNSAVKVGLSSIANSKDLKLTIKKTEEKGSSPGVTPTPTPLPLLAGKTCPPPVYNTIAPLSGYTGTVIQVNGRNLITTKEVKIANVLVPFSSVTVVNDTLIRFVVPKIFTGEVNIYTQIGITTDYGSFSGGTLFNYNPSLSGTSMTSPGSITNPEAANTPVASTTATTATTTTNVTNVAPGVNTNPQNTGPKTLIIVTDSKDARGSTTQLTVRVNPEAGAWKIDTQTDYSYQIEDIVPGPTNRYIGDRIETGYRQPFNGYVSADQQEFSISKEQMIKVVGIDDLDEKNIRAYTQIELYVRPDDKVKNPNDVILNYNFNIFQTDIKEGDPVVATPPPPVTTSGTTFPEKQLSITLVGESPDIQGMGLEYFNIKKPAGGYITFRFNSPDFKDSWYNDRAILNSNNQIAPYSGRLNVDSQTYEYTVNSLGVFKLKISYKPYGFTAPIGGKVLEQIVYSPPFTL
jgi:hypothetical protein